MIGAPSTGTEAPKSGDAAPIPTIRHRRSVGRGYVLVAIVVAVASLLAAGYASGWFRSTPGARPGDCPMGITLLGAGANFISPLMAEWTGPSGAFDAQTSNHVNYNAGGAGFGITAITTRTVDFAATDDPLDDAQTAQLPGPVLTLPITAGALAIVYDLPGAASNLRLSGPLIADIYLGTITRWNDPAIAAVNPGIGLPDQGILTVHREDPAGTTFVLTDLLSRDSTAWASGPGQGIQISWPSGPTQLAFTKNSVLLNYVKSTAYTIGYVDLSDVMNLGWTEYAAILNPAGNYVLPSLSSTTSAITDRAAQTSFPMASDTRAWQNVSMVNAPGAQDYPIATLAYFFVYAAVDTGATSSLARAQVLVEWLDWVVTTGQGFAESANDVPLPTTLVQLDQAGIAALTFSGHAIPACQVA